MSERGLRDTTLARLQRPLPRALKPVLAALLAVGALTFVLGVTGLWGAAADRGRVWLAYHVNFLFWTGLSQAGVVFAASQVITKARWSRPLRRMAEAGGAFLPVAFALYLLLWLGRRAVFPWVAEPLVEPPVKAFWLRAPFVFGRDGAALLLLFGLSLWFLYHSLRPDAALLRTGASGRSKALYDWLARGWVSGPAELARSEARLVGIAPALVLAYAVVMSLVAFDLIMSLAPRWLSSLLGAFFFMSSWLTALASLALVALFWRRHLALEYLISGSTLHDLGKLVFGFTVFWAYLFYSQFLVIWYGNMPEETSFLYLRLAAAPWRGVGIAMVVLVFVIPFWGLLGVAPKKTPALLGLFATVSLLGVWLERYVLVVPSVVQSAPTLPLGWPEIGVTLGFAGLWGLVHCWFAETFPIVSPRLLEQIEAEAGAGGGRGPAH